MKRAEMHEEIKVLRRQRALLVRRCVMLRRLELATALGPGADTSPAAEEEQRWVAANVLRPGERL